MRGGWVVGVVAALVLAGCSAREAPPDAEPAPRAAAAAQETTADLGAAISEPVVDGYYPHASGLGVDALHYELDLTWDPATRVLRGVEELRFRTVVAGTASLDLSARLVVSSAQVDGSPAAYAQDGDVLTVSVPQDEVGAEHRLALTYAGTPSGPGPGAGVQVRDDGGLWTMQEPVGASTWYAVHDQPADKAYYDTVLHVPAPMVGISNGQLESRTEEGGIVTTRFHLDEPAASYLTTLAFGDYVQTSGGDVDGVPVSWWAERDDRASQQAVAVAPDALRWLQDRLGAYPFDTLSLLVVRGSPAAVETQSTITLGSDADYSLAPDTIVHEIAHQWYGDQVTPTDWRELWMNEGMATYLQAQWLSEHGGGSLQDILDGWVDSEARSRREAGPPGRYDPARFAAPVVYQGPALMWDELRRLVGDDAFWDTVRAWPAEHPAGSATREEYVAWLSDRLGRDVAPVLDPWLDDDVSPAR